MLYLGDYLLLAAVGVLLVGSVREIGALEAAQVDRALFEERRRIARAMHDGVAQELALVSSQARHLRHRPEEVGAVLPRLEQAAERAMDDTRTAIGTLRGPLRPRVAAAVTDAALTITERAGVRLDLSVDDDVVVPAEDAALLVRVTRELVGAAVREPGVRVVTVALRRTEATRLRIGHDAPGQEVGAATEQAVASIRERVVPAGGRLDLVRTPAGGLAVEVSLPTRAATGV
jgi:signal transduction histidine kinase